MDYSNSKRKVLYDGQIEFYDKNSLINAICGLLYDNQVKFVMSDEHCDDFGMDCKFDLPCLLEEFDVIMEGLRKKRDFNIEFYEQGREYSFLFIMTESNVKINLRYDHHNNPDTKYEVSHFFVKNMFIELYDSIFQYAAEYIKGISKNHIFIEWNNEINNLRKFKETDDKLTRDLNFQDRQFRLWYYQVSHCEAIIRSKKSNVDDMNIDIYFTGIDYMEVPWIFNGLLIESATEEDRLYLSQKLDKDVPIEKIVVLISEEKKFYVIAAQIKVMKNNLELMELPIERFL